MQCYAKFEFFKYPKYPSATGNVIQLKKNKPYLGELTYDFCVINDLLFNSDLQPTRTTQKITQALLWRATPDLKFWTQTK